MNYNLATGNGLNENEFALMWGEALRLAEVSTVAYLGFKSGVQDFNVEKTRCSGERGFWKLIGIDMDEIDSELDDDLLTREDFLHAMQRAEQA